MRGLGLRRMHDRNRALIAKLGWLLLKNPNSLWAQSISAKYLKNHHFFDNIAIGGSSWFWQGVTATSDLVKAGVCVLVRNGRKINIWTDPWVPKMPQHLAILNPSCQFSYYYSKVHQLIDWDSLCWKHELIHCLFTPECAREILNVPLTSISEEDSISWTMEPSGTFQ